MLDALLANLASYWPVHLLLTLYTALLAWHAWTGHRRTRGLADYYVGGRSLGGVALGLSFFATYSSTNSFVGFSGQSYGWGIAWLLLAPGAIVASAAAWLFVAPRLRAFTEALDSLTIPDFIGFRFGSETARVVAAVIVLFASFFYMTAVFKGIGALLRAFLEIPYPLAIGLVFLVVVAYTVLGGFISVVKTDAVQGVVMIVAAVILFAGTVRAAGGLGSVAALSGRPQTDPLLQWSGVFPLPWVLGVIFAGTVKFVAEPRQLSRFYALESAAAVRTGFWVSTAAFALVYTVLVPVGLYARLVLGDGIADTDQVVPTLLVTAGVFSVGAAAFLLVAMVAAAMSSLDSVLLVMASTAERDLVTVLRRRQGDEAREVRNTRLWVALFAAVTAVLALDPAGGIVTLTVLSGALYGACFVPPVILGLFWRRGDGVCVLAAFAVGVASLLLWPALPASAVVHEVFPALALSLTVYVSLAWVREPVASPVLDRLFD